MCCLVLVTGVLLIQSIGRVRSVWHDALVLARLLERGQIRQSNLMPRIYHVGSKQPEETREIAAILAKYVRLLCVLYYNITKGFHVTGVLFRSNIQDMLLIAETN